MVSAAGSVDGSRDGLWCVTFSSNHGTGIASLTIQDELMKRADVTAAFILSSSIAILASEQVCTFGFGVRRERARA